MLLYQLVGLIWILWASKIWIN